MLNSEKNYYLTNQFIDLSHFLLCLPVCSRRAEEQQVLGQTNEKQRGGETVARGASPQGEPDSHARPIPGGGEPGPQGRGGQSQEGEHGAQTNDGGPGGEAKSAGREPIES